MKTQQHKTPAQWFSRHAPTPAQLDDAMSLGYEIVAIPDGMAMGSVSLETEEQVASLRKELALAITASGAKAVFGVFPTPMLASLAETPARGGNRMPLAVYAAWNVTRTPEGGKPTFCHKKWQKIGGRA